MRKISWSLYIDWSKTGTYVNESSRLISANGGVRLASPESGISSPRGTVDQCTLSLRNDDGRYSPLNTSSPIYAHISKGNTYHAPMYLSVGVADSDEHVRVFTGVIKIPREAPPTPRNAGVIQIDCRSRDEILLNRRLSTSLATFVDLHDSNATESEIIAQFLDDAGIDPSESEIDPGLFIIPWAWLDDESPMEDIWMLAAACGGRFYCDQEGYYRYENMAHWLFSPHNTSQETITESGYSQMAGPLYEDRELYSKVTIIASPREILESSDLWKSPEIITVPANSSKTVIAKLRQPMYEYGGVEYTAVTGGKVDIAGSISITETQLAQRIVFEITNSHPTHAANLYPFTVTGRAVSGSPSLEESRETEEGFWLDFPDIRPGRTRLFQSNPYLQTLSQARGLAEFLRDRFQLPRLSGKLMNVPGVTSRRPGDRITVGSTPAMSATRDVFITAVDWRLSSRGFVQDLEWLDAGNVSDGTGLFPFDEYFVIGTHELGEDTDPDARPVFY